MDAYNIIQNMTLPSLFEFRWIDCCQPFVWKITYKMIYAAYTKPKMHVVSNIIHNRYLEKLEDVQDANKNIWQSKSSDRPFNFTLSACLTSWKYLK